MFDNNDTIRNKQKTGNDAKEEKRNNDKTTAKAAAAAILGAALGVGGANAVQAATTEEPEAQPQPQQTQPQPEAKPEPKPEPKPVEEEHHEEEEHVEPVKVEQPEQHEPKPTPATDNDKSIIIHSVETGQDEDGNQYMLAHATVNGNNAVLLADENGHIQTAAIDMNGNGEVDENEIGNVSEANLYINGNSVEVHQPEVQVSAAGDGPEVRVISVENDVDLNGQTVDVAAVTINDQNVIFVDSDQNGEVNVMITDVNGNGEIEQDEMGDVSEHHIAMPTADDVMQPGVTEVSDPMGGDDLPDYSNNADITMYDV